jgi:Domain of unknown function (DUF5667)
MGFDEVLAICLDALDGGQGVAELLRRYPNYAEELKPLLDAAVWFGGQAAALEPRAGFVKASRARLVQQIASPPAVTATSWLGRMSASLGSSWRIALQAAVVLVMLVCLVVGSTGIAYASQNALPGDALYPVKLGLEQVELLVTLDPQADLRLHMQFSQLRIVEMQRLLALGRYEDLAIASANYRYHIRQALSLLRMLAAQDAAHAQASALEVEVALTAQADTLGMLADIAPEAARAELEAAEQAARDGAQEAHEIGGDSETPQPTVVTGEEEEPQATETPTAAVTATNASFSVVTLTPTPEPSLTPTPTATSTQTRTPTPTPTRTPTRTPVGATTRTATATVKPSVTPTPKASQIAVPTATRTPKPTPTRTSQPTPTATIQPTPTRTGQPTPTRTTQPTPTRTGQPTPTRTSQPTPTRTTEPSPTATLPPVTPTATNIAPTPTRTPRPTQPLPPTDTPVPYPYPSPN